MSDFKRLTPTVLEYTTNPTFWADRVIEQTEYIHSIPKMGLSIQRQIELDRSACEVRDRCFNSYLRYKPQDWEDPRLKYYGATADLYGETPLTDRKR